MTRLSSPGLVNWVLIVALGVIWGTAFMGVSLALEGMTPWWVSTGRIALAAVILVVLGAALGQPVWALTSPSAWLYSTLIGVGAIACPITLLSWGLTQVPSAFAGVAMGAVPLIVLPLVFLFSPEEGIGPRRIAGIAMGFAGLVILVGPGAMSGGTFWGQLACVLAAGCYAGGSVLTRRAPEMPPIAFATATLITGAAALLPLAFLLEGPPVISNAGAGWALVYVALFPTGLAAVMRIWVIRSAGSLFMSLTSYMVPVWAVIFGATIMGEDLPPQLFMALALILGGIGLSQMRLLKR